MTKKILGLLAVGLLAGPMAAGASVIYSFSGYASIPKGTQSFVYTAQDYIGVQTRVLPGSLDSCTGVRLCTWIVFNPVNAHGSVYSGIDFKEGALTVFYYFPEGALGADGTYTTTIGSNTGTLTVRYSSTAMPEPGTLALLGLGLIGVGIGRRERTLS